MKKKKPSRTTRVKCFMIEPTGRYNYYLRRYSKEHTCKDGWCHNAMTFLHESPVQKVIGDIHPHDDSHWPATCEKCCYQFQESDHWQLFHNELYKRGDNGEVLEFDRRKIPPGAMWYADWMNDFHTGPDGRCLVVMTPGGEWIIDSRASNCTMPNDKEHKCWIRHGTPPMVTVDKTGGKTCAAGAGSIIAGNYHGFLVNGEFT